MFYNKISAQTVIQPQKVDSASAVAEQLQQSIIALDNALLNRDSVALENLLSDEVEIKHSNGWVQSKEDVFKDFRDSTLRYDKILGLGIKNGDISYKANVATVTRVISTIGRFKEYDFNMMLTVKEEWIYENEQWQLWSRRSEKMN